MTRSDSNILQLSKKCLCYRSGYYRAVDELCNELRTRIESSDSIILTPIIIEDFLLEKMHLLAILDAKPELGAINMQKGNELSNI